MKNIADIITEAGGATKIAALMGVSKHTVATWKHRNRVPSERVAALSASIGVPKSVIRPDIFGEDQSK